MTTPSPPPIYGASFYKVHAFAGVTVLEIQVELEGGLGGVGEVV